MSRNLKYQFLNAINNCFSEKMDKHSIKKSKLRNSGKIFSYADRKALIDLAANFSNFMHDRYSKVKMVKDIKTEHIQEFLNSKKDYCSNNTLEQYGSKFRKLEKIVNQTYNIKTNYSDFVVPVSKEKTKIRNTSMSKEDFKKLENYFKTSNSKGGIAIQLGEKLGLRVSECSKLKGVDIDLKEGVVRIVDSKGKRSRNVPIREKDKKYFKVLKQFVGDARVCPVQTSSINRSIRRAMEKTNIDKKYKDTNMHSIRKMYAQHEYDKRREEGIEIKQALGEVSVLLGHSQDRVELMSSYVLNIH